LPETSSLAAVIQDYQNMKSRLPVAGAADFEIIIARTLVAVYRGMPNGSPAHGTPTLDAAGLKENGCSWSESPRVFRRLG
jgi:hypothetical protein